MMSALAQKVERQIPLADRHLAQDALIRLDGIIDSSGKLILENDPQNDLWSIGQIGSYAVGFTTVINEITDAYGRGDTSRDDFHSVVERAEIFCGIAERACNHGR